jgi:hypothetical protein
MDFLQSIFRQTCLALGAALNRNSTESMDGPSSPSVKPATRRLTSLR